MREKIVDKPVGFISVDVSDEETLKCIERMIRRRSWLLYDIL
jgi:hypothetical protein